MTPLLGIYGASVQKATTAFESIASATGTGSSGTITFSSVPSTYQHLQLRILGKDTYNATNVSALKITFNSVGGSSYSSHNLYVYDGVIYADAYTSRGDIYIGYGMPQSPAGKSNTFGAAIIDIHDYASTTKNKTVRAFMGSETNAQADSAIALSSGLFMNTSAISSISISIETLYWNSSSTIALYGIRG
jgi:hypothetical protein